MNLKQLGRLAAQRLFTVDLSLGSGVEAVACRLVTRESTAPLECERPGHVVVVPGYHGPTAPRADGGTRSSP